MVVTSRVEYNERFTFFSALSGLLAEPFSTVERLLLETERPPYIFSLFLCWAITIFVPISAQLYKYPALQYRTGPVISIALILLFTALIFIFVEGIFLLLIGIPVTIRQLSATVSYTLAPTILVIWVLYLTNYIIDGKLSLVLNLIKGYGPISANLAAVLPIIGFVMILYMLVVFYSCIVTIGDVQPLSGTVITLLTIVGPLVASVCFAMFLAELALPGSIGVFKQVLQPASKGIGGMLLNMLGGFLDGLLAYFNLTGSR